MASAGSRGGTIHANPHFDAEKAAEALRKAMKGFGTDEKAIIKVLTTCNNEQRQQIKTVFKTMFGKDLNKELKSELGGNLEDAVMALMKDRIGYDAQCLREAMKGMGTDESVLIEILATRSNADIEAIKAKYQKAYDRDLEKDLMSETGGHFKRILVSLVQGNRNESTAVDHAKAKEQAKALFEAGEGRWGTDESAFNKVFMLSSNAQLRAVFEEYRKISDNDIFKAVEKEMSGDLEDAFLCLIEAARNPAKLFARRAYKSMKGMGTDEKTLIRVLVTRSEIDLADVKEAFMNDYNKSLAKMVKDDCRGDFERVLLAIIDPEK